MYRREMLSRASRELTMCLTVAYPRPRIVVVATKRPHRLMVRTPGSHPDNGGSIPPGVTNNFRQKVVPKVPSTQTPTTFFLKLLAW